MISFLYSLVGFIAAIAVLVTIHEFGHYWVAKKMGVKVLKFSVGFGKPLWKKVAGEDQTEYIVGAIPLGGFVKMLDEREGDVAEHEKHRAFTQKSVYKRFAIVAAGPAFNFIFAILAYWILFMVGVGGYKPIVGEITPNSIADKAGLQSEQLIVAVNDKEVVSWSSTRFNLLQNAIDTNSVDITVISQDQQRAVKTLDISHLELLKDESDFLRTIGLNPWRPKIAPSIGSVMAGGAAEKAGFKAGDKIISIDGVAIEDSMQWVKTIQASAGKELNVVVNRVGSELSLKPIPEIKTVDGQTIGLIGVRNHLEITPEIREKITVTERLNPVDALLEGISRTWQMSGLIIKTLAKLVIGEASIKNLSGPITIAHYAGVSAQIGFESFITFLALISISLGVMNLLPIPVLDGGHLFYYVIEMVKGSAVSEQFELMGQKVGLFLLLCFMSIAIYNDILRLVN